MRHKLRFIHFFLLMLLSSACRTGKHYMFKTEDSSFQQIKAEAESNYKIQPDDYLNVFVYTNKGERIVDPNYELSSGNTSGEQVEELNPRFLVRKDGNVKLPMVGLLYLKDLTATQADSVLEIHYSKFYEDVYVITKLINKRVTVIGPLGGKVIPLQNENMNLIEVLALYGGVHPDGKPFNLRLIRGELNNPQVEVIDLSTIDGMKKATLKIAANDVIYIEPRRKLLTQSIRDVSAFLALAGNLITTTLLLTRYNN